MKYIIEDYTDLLEIEINEYIENFNPTQLKGQVIGSGFVNDYNKQFIYPTDELIQNVKNIILNHLEKYNLVYGGTRLNLIETNTNPSDNFHTDSISGNVIFLHYPKLNPYFEGGELEWKDENENSDIIKIKNGMNLILVNNPPHRVLNVTSGKRFSFAFFFNGGKVKGLI